MNNKNKKNIGKKEIPKKLRKIRRRIRFILSIILVVGVVSIVGKATNQIPTKDEKYLLMGERPIKKAIIYSLENEIEKIDIEKEEEKLENQKKEIAKEKDINKKIAYLTFDDGPTTNITPQILDILDNYDIKATFFVIGKLADANPNVLKDTLARGHKIGNHSYTHNYNTMYKSYDTFYAEIDRANKALSGILGEDFKTDLIRFPSGCFGEQRKGYAKRLEAEGYKVYNWNALNGDAEGLNKSVAYLRDRFVTTVGNKKELVILMHDAGDKKNTVAYLPEAIEYLLNRGYEFRVLG